MSSSLSLPWPFRGGAKHRLRRKEESAASSSAAAQVEELGVTPQLLDFTKGFTVDTFKNFPIQVYSTANGDLDASSGSNPNDDLSEWQERHAMLLLARSKEISQIRYALCPRVLQDNQFWRIYFFLVKKYVVSYEMHAIQKANLKNDSEKEKSWNKAGIEVEMTESKHACCTETVLQTNGIGGEVTGVIFPLPPMSPRGLFAQAEEKTIQDVNSKFLELPSPRPLELRRTILLHPESWPSRKYG